MHVFIDESGDAGMQLGGGSSPYFCIVAVIFNSGFSVDACDRAIEVLRHELRFPELREFHFTNCSNHVRDAFFRCVAQEEFCYHGFVINKANLTSRRFQDSKEFYEFAVSVVCENARNLLENAKIIIDKHGNRDFKDRLKRSIRRQICSEDGRSLIRDVRMESSHSSNLVQLADMICGAVARSISHPKENKWREVLRLRRKERRVQFWPR